MISQFESGGTDLGFIDNPAEPTQEAQLINGRGFAYIPIAVTTTDVAFLTSQDSLDTLDAPTPVTQFNITPTMLAGLLTTADATPFGGFTTPGISKSGSYFGSDNLIAAIGNAIGTSDPVSTCADLVLCQYLPPGTKKLGPIQELTNSENANAFMLLNPEPAGELQPTVYGTFVSSIANGASYEGTDWLCRQPTQPFDVDVQLTGQPAPSPLQVTDTNLAPTVLTSYPNGSSAWSGNRSTPWVYPACTATSTLPPIPTGGSTTQQYYEAFLDPGTQAATVRNVAYLGTSTPSVTDRAPVAAFALMDSSEAIFNGLSEASLQNDAGNFVSPNPQTVADALKSFQACPTGAVASLTCPPGTYSFNYTGYDPANPSSYASDAYPMVNITYAIVPTAPQAEDQATAMKNLLTNLVTYSHSGGSIPLPTGYYPLPDSLYQAALSDINTDIVAAPVPTTPGGTSPPGASPAGTSSSSGGAEATSGGFTPGATVASTSGGLTPSGSNASATTSADASPFGPQKASTSGSPAAANALGSTSVPAGYVELTVDNASRLLLPALIVLAVACLIGGPLLLYVPEVRRRRKRAGGST